MGTEEFRKYRLTPWTTTQALRSLMLSRSIQRMTSPDAFFTSQEEERADSSSELTVTQQTKSQELAKLLDGCRHRRCLEANIITLSRSGTSAPAQKARRPVKYSLACRLQSGPLLRGTSLQREPALGRVETTQIRRAMNCTLGGLSLDS